MIRCDFLGSVLVSISPFRFGSDRLFGWRDVGHVILRNAIPGSVRSSFTYITSNDYQLLFIDG